MGLFSKSKKTSESEDALAPSGSDSLAFSSDVTDASNPSSDQPKKSLYARYKEMKRGPGTSNMTDEDYKKYTGMDRAEFDKWSATTPGVAGGQAAGSITAGGTSNIGIAGGTGEGLGGWGHEAGKTPDVR